MDDNEIQTDEYYRVKQIKKNEWSVVNEKNWIKTKDEEHNAQFGGRGQTYLLQSIY
jgi:hypothetical protein